MAWPPGDLPCQWAGRGAIAPLFVSENYKIHQHQAAENDEPKTAY
jgi:hypothetical protein